MRRIEYIKGQKFNKITYLEEVYPNIEPSGRKRRRALFLCYCGEKFESSILHIKSGKTESCGCYNKKMTKEMFTTHGLRNERLYVIWINIKNRCFNINHPRYKDYGGRGIIVHKEWIDDFKSFYDYVSKLENYNINGYSLDRKDNNGNYEPGNIRWADRTTQNRNQRRMNNNISGFIGVSRCGRKWVSSIKVNKKHIYIGLFNNKIDAAKARDKYIIDNNLKDFTMNNIL
jgi:hypothetical protein